MRYLLQGTAMLADLVIIVALAVVLFGFVAKGDGVCLIALVLGIVAWRRSGIFSAWKPSNIKSFMRNAKELGL